METFSVIMVIACVPLLFMVILSLNYSKSKSKCPPGPKSMPFISNILWLLKSTLEIETSVRLLCSKYGKIITLHIASHPVIFITSRSLAHQALVQNGTVFADRPKPFLTAKILTCNQHNISSACYGSTWRLLRKNLTAQILHPSRTKEFSHTRKWVLDMLLNRLKNSAVTSNKGVVRVLDHFRFAMFSLLMFMCFGDKLNESQISEAEAVQRRLLTSFNRFLILDICRLPLSRIVFCRRWNEFFDLQKKREELLLPHIRARKKMLEPLADRHSPKVSIQAKTLSDGISQLATSYVDTLFTLEVPEEGNGTAAKRKLTEEELVNLCSEFLNAGTDTTTTAMQWIMANLIKYPHIQAKLFEEIKGVVGENCTEVKKDELSKMPYLKAVVLEGLRRHPPSHFVLPHALTEEVELGGYTLPKNAIINFMVAEMGLDPALWESPMQFKPERFLSIQGTEEFDVTGRREIKMMPFGAGRRMCPAIGLAILHLQYFVVNLVWNFKWEAIEGDEIDLSEKQEFSIVMKHPLHAHISPKITI
ncbi:cytochrome P450 89A2-like [Chenopodium quinoa]|uniref:cytochrome P450 89A2-like n=1 Tax=Chenopodium quinoa TaxID=63459 RepID=UPI000B7777BB|nr:cytochrome P450 89A2-like [Chenopodium quinoa]